MTTYHEFELKKLSHRPKSFCVPALELPTLSQEVKKTKSFNLGEALQSYYPLLELIFKYLDKQALRSVKLVNTIWKELAEKELNKRIWPSWVSFTNHNWLTCSEGFSYNNVAIGIFVYNPSLINLGRNLCLHTTLKKKMLSVTDYMDIITLETQLNYCTIACASVSSILPLNKYNSDVAFQGLFIPVIPNIRTVMFESYPKSLDLRDHINPMEKVKCCLIFSKRSRGIENLLLALLNGQNPQDVAVGGGMINSKKSLLMPECENLSEQAIFCITFLQSEEANFNAYSVVIINQNEDTVGFTEELIRFKERTVLYKYGVIFRFCCKAKIWKDDETEIIQKHFPNFIVFGIDVEGEIGWNTFDVPDFLVPKIKKRKDALPNYLYGWSTVLVLITWNK